MGATIPARRVQKQDVVFSQDKRSAALLFGRATRGDSSKTGRDQGVQVDCPYCIQILRRRLHDLRADKDLVFPISAAVYRQWWRRASREVLGEETAAGPPHSARHTGASRDLALKYRTFEQVQRRGRWKSSESCQRYGRVHAWFEACSKVPTDVQAKGRDLLANRPQRHRCYFLLKRSRFSRPLVCSSICYF